MSDWSREGDTLNILPPDVCVEIDVEYVPRNNLISLKLTDRDRKEETSIEMILSGRNLEVFMEFLNEKYKMPSSENADCGSTMSAKQTEGK